MCQLNFTSKAKWVHGYKVVLKEKRTGKYFSPAMGCEYPKDGPVPVVTKQKCLSENFNDQILENADYGFSSNMVGRTSAFKEYDAALDLARDLSFSGFNQRRFELRVVKIRLKEELMTGVYLYRSVWAGKYMKILCEVKKTDAR